MRRRYIIDASRRYGTDYDDRDVYHRPFSLCRPPLPLPQAKLLIHFGMSSSDSGKSNSTNPVRETVAYVHSDAECACDNFITVCAN